MINYQYPMTNNRIQIYLDIGAWALFGNWKLVIGNYANNIYVKVVCTFSKACTNLSISSGVLYIPTLARFTVSTPSACISGCAQWWPPRIATPNELQISATSCGWIAFPWPSCTTNEKIAARSCELAGPNNFPNGNFF